LTIIKMFFNVKCYTCREAGSESHGSWIYKLYSRVKRSPGYTIKEIILLSKRE